MITDSDMSPVAAVTSEKVDIACNPAINLASVPVWTYTPGFAFQFLRARSFCRNMVGTVTFAVSVGGRTAVTGALFTTGAEVNAALSAVMANLRGSKTEAISLLITSNGTGALTDGHVVLEFRPWPVAGESGPGDGPRKF